MAITCWPSDIEPKCVVTCALCTREVAVESATAGLMGPCGEQTFACEAHFWSKAELIGQWSAFMVRHLALLVAAASPEANQ